MSAALVSLLPISGSPEGRAPKPLVVEVPGVAVGHDAVCPHAGALGRCELKTECQQWDEDRERHHGRRPDQLNLELEQRGAFVKDPIGERSGKKCPVGLQDWREHLTRPREGSRHVVTAVRLGLSN